MVKVCRDLSLDDLLNTDVCELIDLAENSSDPELLYMLYRAARIIEENEDEWERCHAFGIYVALLSNPNLPSDVIETMKERLELDYIISFSNPNTPSSLIEEYLEYVKQGVYSIEPLLENLESLRINEEIRDKIREIVPNT